MKKCKKNLVEIIAIVGILAVVLIGYTWEKEQICTYIFQKKFIEITGFSAEEQIEALSKDNPKAEVCEPESVYASEDGSMIIQLTESQWKEWMKYVEEEIKKSEKRVKRVGGNVEVSRDRTRVIFEVSPECEMGFLSDEGVKMIVYTGMYQTLAGKQQKWEVYLCFKNIETGEIIADGTLPYDTIEFTEEDLN